MNQIEVPPEILNLPIGDRLVLMGKIWDSINADGPPPISDQQQKLLDARLEDLEANPNRGEPWDKVRSELFGNQ